MANDILICASSPLFLHPLEGKETGSFPPHHADVSAYPLLIRTLTLLMPEGSSRLFLLSWKRRLRGAKAHFLDLLQQAGFSLHVLQNRLWGIQRSSSPTSSLLDALNPNLGL